MRFVKVHDAYTLTPNGEPLLAGRRGADGAIVIVRDPRDVAPSLANHNRFSIDDAIAFMNDRNAGFCAKTRGNTVSFGSNCPAGAAISPAGSTRPTFRFILIRYEDMQADTVGTFRRALEFAGRAASDEEIRRAVAFADFAELRRQEQDKGLPRDAGAAGRPILPPRRGRRLARRTDAEQVARIEAAHAPMMRRLGYELAGAMPLARAI